MHEFSTQNGKTFDTPKNYSIPCYPKELLFSPDIHSNNEQHPVPIHDSGTSDMIQNDLYTSYGTSDLDDHVSDDDSLCNDCDDTKIMFDNELYKSVNVDDDYHHLVRSNSDSEK